MNESKRFGYLDWIKVISIVLVVVIHLCAPVWKTYGCTGPNWNWICGYSSIAHVAVPLFLMVSGALFLDPGRELPMKKLWLKYILRLVIAFVVWSAIYAAVDLFVDGVHLSSVLINFVTGHYHMWFIFVLLMLYAVTPFLRKIAADRTLLGYFLLLSAVFTVILPFIGRYAGAVATFSGYFYMQMVCGYTFCFAAGYYLHAYPIKKVARILLYVGGVLGAVATIVMVAKSRDDYWFDAFAPGMAAMYLALFTAARYGLKERSAPRLIAVLSGCTLGAYLMHDLFLQLLQRIDAVHYVSEAFWMVPVISVAVAAVSFALSWLGKKIPLIGKYLF